ncbi:MAG: type II secretion system protein GspG [Planctomycetia bacterium]|nr:type II secretion system protein GspG [Planctomycetia bacterium]
MFGPRFWSILFGMTVVALWGHLVLNMADMPSSYLREKPSETCSKAVLLEKRLEEFREKNGNYPETLAFLPEEERLDSWGKPFQYDLREGKWEITSLGADGKSGGVGLDLDLKFTVGRDSVVYIYQTKLTLSQKLSHPHVQSCMVYCVLASVCVGFFFCRYVALGKKKMWEKILIFPLLAFCC